MAFRSLRTLAAFLPLFLAPSALAGDDDWESPVYNYFFQFPLPIPPTLAPLTCVSLPIPRLLSGRYLIAILVLTPTLPRAFQSIFIRLKFRPSRSRFILT